MVDNSPQFSPGVDQIFAKLNGMPGSTPLNVAALLGLGNVTPNGAQADTYLETVYPTADLASTTPAATEWLNYVRFLNQQFFNRFQQRDIILFGKRLPALALLAADAKYELTGQIGPVSNGTIIPSLIRPVTVYASTAAKVQNWIAAVVAGWTAPFWTVNLNATGTGTLLTPQNRVVMEILGLGDFATSPKLVEWQFKDPAGRPLGVHTVPYNHAVNALNIWEFDQAYLIQKNKQFTVDLNFDAASATDIPAVLGAQITTSDYATDEAT